MATISCVAEANNDVPLTDTVCPVGTALPKADVMTSISLLPDPIVIEVVAVVAPAASAKEDEESNVMGDGDGLSATAMEAHGSAVPKVHVMFVEPEEDNSL